MMHNKVVVPEELLWLPYDYDGGYHWNLERAQSQGINCKGLVGLYHERVLGIAWPEDAQVAELLGGHKDFDTVTAWQPPKVGDIYIFGPARNVQRAKRYTPRYDPEGNLTNYFFMHSALLIDIRKRLFLHAQPSGSTVSRYDEMAKNPDYSDVFAIKRHKALEYPVIARYA